MVERGMGGLADQLFWIPAEHARGCGVSENDPALEIDAVDPLTDRGQDQLRLPQGGFHPAALSKILIDRQTGENEERHRHQCHDQIG